MHYLAVDSGTTNSRIWLMRDREVLERIQISIGVRNTARDGNKRALLEGIRQPVLELKNSLPSREAPRFAIAAGMITSNLGLHEVKHTQAPAGIHELSSKIEERSFPEMQGISFYFVPGVRSGPLNAELSNVNEIDIVRGEETEVIGALRNFGLQGPLLYIHLGSHTKFIKVDASNRISGSASTLTGELYSAVQQQTILGDSLPHDSGFPINEDFLRHGWNYCRKYGLVRALYLIRILDLNSNYPKESMALFFDGVLMSEEFRCLDTLIKEDSQEKVVLSGLPQIHAIWLHFLGSKPWEIRSLSAAETEQAFLNGLYEIARTNPQLFSHSY